jgi:hypothetical protein
MRKRCSLRGFHLKTMDRCAPMIYHGKSFNFMESLFFDYHPETLVETVSWVFRAYLSHGFHLTYWSAHLETWVKHLRQELDPADFEQLYPFFHWIIAHVPIFTKLSEQALEQ